MRARLTLLRAAVAAAGAWATRAGAQPLADRVARAGDGQLRFHYAVRAGVCGDGGRGVTIAGPDGTSTYGHYVDSDDVRWGTRSCVPGPAFVTLALRGGVPRDVRLAVGRPRDAATEPPVVDLGAVPAAAAAAYLLDLAARDGVPSPNRVLLAAAVADSATIWPRLLGLARDQRVARVVRREATFWTSRYACDAVTEAAAVRADTADREVRKQVVFALSQRPSEEGGPTLTRVARRDRDPAVRCAALFWLGQGGRGRDTAPATLDLYEEVLRGR